MKWVRSVSCALMLLTLVLVLCPSTEARAECKTQGDLALALAQVLNFEVKSQEDAIAKLSSIGVRPIDDWKPAQCLTAEVVLQIEESLRKAVVLKSIDGELAQGAVERALTAIGAVEFIPDLKRAQSFLPGEEQSTGGGSVSEFRPPQNRK